MAKYWMIWLAIKFISNLGFCINLFCVYMYKDVEKIRFFKKKLTKRKRIWRIPCRVKQKERESETERRINKKKYYRNLYRLLYVWGLYLCITCVGESAKWEINMTHAQLIYPIGGGVIFEMTEGGDQNFYI